MSSTWADDSSSDDGSIEHEDGPYNNTHSNNEPQRDRNYSAIPNTHLEVRDSATQPIRPPYRVFIKNINFKSSRDQVGVFFEDNGCDIKALDMMERGGSAAMEFKDEASMRTALSMTGAILDGKELRVYVWNEKSGTRRSHREDHHRRGGSGKSHRYQQDSQDYRQERGRGYRGHSTTTRTQKVNTTTKEPSERPRIQLKPRTLPLDEVGKPSEAPAGIFGEGKPHDELLYEEKRRKEQDVMPPPPPKNASTVPVDEGVPAEEQGNSSNVVGSTESEVANRKREGNSGREGGRGKNAGRGRGSGLRRKNEIDGAAPGSINDAEDEAVRSEGGLVVIPPEEDKTGERYNGTKSRGGGKNRTTSGRSNKNFSHKSKSPSESVPSGELEQGSDQLEKAHSQVHSDGTRRGGRGGRSGRGSDAGRAGRATTNRTREGGQTRSLFGVAAQEVNLLDRKGGKSKDVADASKSEDKSLAELSGAERFHRAQQRIKEESIGSKAHHAGVEKKKSMKNSFAMLADDEDDD